MKKPASSEPSYSHCLEPVRQTDGIARERHQGRARMALVVDDDPMVCELLSLILGRRGWLVETAEDGFEALAMVTQGNGYDLLFTDIRMPGMTGIDLALVVRKVLPGLEVIFTSGMHGDDLAAMGLKDEDVFVRKPFCPESVEAALHSRRQEALAA